VRPIVRPLIATLAVLLAALPIAAVAQSTGFVISAVGMADNGLLTKEGGSDTLSSDGKRPCGGLNRAPGFTWANAPAKTASFAILEEDPDGRVGLGVHHWVHYNIPASVTTFRAPTSGPRNTRRAWRRATSPVTAVRAAAR